MEVCEPAPQYPTMNKQLQLWGCFHWICALQAKAWPVWYIPFVFFEPALIKQRVLPVSLSASNTSWASQLLRNPLTAGSTASAGDRTLVLMLK